MKVVCGVVERGRPHGAVLGEMGLYPAPKHETGAAGWSAPYRSESKRAPRVVTFICGKHGLVVVHPADERKGALVAHDAYLACPGP